MAIDLDISKLTREEKLRLIDALVESVETDGGIPDWHAQILEERLKRMTDSPHEGYSIRETFQRVRTNRAPRSADCPHQHKTNPLAP